MKFQLLHLLAFLTTSPLSAHSATIPAALEARQVSGVTITSVTYSGAGCPQGSVQTLLTSGASLVTFYFDNMLTIFNSANTRSCNIVATLGLPAGFRFAVQSAQYQGEADLDAGIISAMSSTYSFGSGGPSTTANFVGAYSSSFDVTRSVASNVRVFSSCGPTSVQLRVGVSSSLSNSGPNPAAGGFAELSSLGLGLQWVGC
jgi:hypothetical protein